MFLFTIDRALTVVRRTAAYGNKYKSLTKIIKSEFRGHMQSALLHIVKGVKPKRAQYGEGVWRDAKLIEQSMKGLGTDDLALMSRYELYSLFVLLELLTFGQDIAGVVESC